MTADRSNRRHKVGSHHVCQSLDWSAGALGLAYHFHDLRKQCVGPDAFGLHHEAARPVDRSSGDFGIDSFFHRNGLATDHGFVNGAAALDDHSVSRNFLAWSDTELVAHLDGLQVHVLLRAVP
jgi:hypothetical protein